MKSITIHNLDDQLDKLILEKSKKLGTPIPINDIWIASKAMENGAFLVTYNKHFANVSGLLCWKYI